MDGVFGDYWNKPMPIIRWTSTSRAAHVVWSFSWAAILGGCGIALSLDGYSAEEADLCLDGKKNQNETGIDCGGSCAPCTDNQGCIVGTDCTSLVCIGNLCRAPSCTDGVKNGDELGVDCRGSCVSQKCVAGEFCNANNDCIGGQCFENACAETCSDKSQNGQETGLDCGGPDCPGCLNGQECALNRDCESGVCTGGTCADFHDFSKGFGDFHLSNFYFPTIKVASKDSARIVIGGEFLGDVNFGQGLESNQGTNWPKIYLAQFDGSGNCAWSHSFGASDHSQHVGTISTNTIGDAALVGYHFGDIDVGGGLYPKPPTSANALIAVFNASGQHQWSLSLGPSGNVFGTGGAMNEAGEVLVIGSYKGTLDFGNGALLSQGGSKDIFLVRFQKGGTALWAKSFGDTDNQYEPLLAENNQGHAALAGTLTGTMDFGGGPLTATPMVKTNLIAVLDNQGNHLWSRALAHSVASKTFNIHAVQIDSADYVTISGTFTQSIQFDDFTLNTGDIADVFVARFNPSGTCVWARSFGNASNSEAIHSMSSATDGSMVITGKFSNTIDIDGQTLTGAGTSSMFVLKLAPDGTSIWRRAFGGSVWTSSVAAQGLENAVVGAIYGVVGPMDFGGGALPVPPNEFSLGLARLILP